MGPHDPKFEGLDGLLELDRQVIEVGNGYWVAIRARLVPKDAGRPHGIEYALTFHTPGGRRLVGYDNAHAPHARSGPSGRSRRPVEFDHVHRRHRVKRYLFETPGKLLRDFWADVETMLKEEGIT
ncbi:MAG: DUF6516 family protein [Alphaproteobacteria bacterium]|jgi:hypothetical protein|nr:DUF6516 family protein [Alphaproteobacteria bacterium]MDP6564997.1 DUF6516 family protein [Alphaproteobacteria bacterium]|tara:strand:- start:90 stop:464 length:375 start_codon:yes stop_codon:yes gene_type:complete